MNFTLKSGLATRKRLLTFIGNENPDKLEEVAATAVHYNLVGNPQIQDIAVSTHVLYNKAPLRSVTY